ncbi:MAG: VOC family protein [Candidatus Latescibacterota bacterium]|jgi:predicted enzyme related to lactoylglutathione lyase
MNRVTGIGGVFFKSESPEKLKEWYWKHLGVTPDDQGYVMFEWREKDEPEKMGMTAWEVFKADTDYFDKSDAPFMINYRVENLLELLETLREEGVDVDDNVAEAEYGKFGWVYDPDGNKIELWEPPEE